MGSRILSRSFHVELWGAGEEDNQKNTEEDPDTSMESRRSMDVDRSREEQPEEDEENGSDGGSDSDDENVEDVAMVPMADMLNARYGGENVSARRSLMGRH
jgi:SET domain-containing protein 6